MRPAGLGGALWEGEQVSVQRLYVWEEHTVFLLGHTVGAQAVYEGQLCGGAGC